MSKTNKPIGRKDEIVVQEVDGEVLIYDLRNDKAFCLNATSAAIWRLCDGDKSIAEIVDRVAKEFKATNSEDLVWLALDQLKKEKLIDGGLDAKYDHFDGMSRRQVIKKIGVGSMVAIPVVASLVAPTAALAQTCTGSGTLAPGAETPAFVFGGDPNGICDGGSPAPYGAACNANRASSCCSGMATYNTGVGSSCSPLPIGANITLTCSCA